MNTLLKVENATKHYGGLFANDDISFSVYEGEIFGIIGPNGAGKTTLFNSISGAHPITSGRIIFNGSDVTGMKAHRICKLGLGRTFQIPQSLDTLTVLENVMVGGLCRYHDIHQARSKAEEIVSFCELDNDKNSLVGSLNVIRKKRVEIARALATQPRLLLLDETMAGLNNTERKQAVELIFKINKTGCTIITIEHNMDVVMSVSNRVLVIHLGKFLKVGAPEEITKDEDVIKAYLGGAANA